MSLYILAFSLIFYFLQARPETRVVWVDAHADINTDRTSPSGNIHGMPIALLMGLIDVRLHFPKEMKNFTNSFFFFIY